MHAARCGTTRSHSHLHMPSPALAPACHVPAPLPLPTFTSSQAASHFFLLVSDGYHHRVSKPMGEWGQSNPLNGENQIYLMGQAMSP